MGQSHTQLVNSTANGSAKGSKGLNGVVAKHESHAFSVGNLMKGLKSEPKRFVLNTAPENESNGENEASYEDDNYYENDEYEENNVDVNGEEMAMQQNGAEGSELEDNDEDEMAHDNYDDEDERDSGDEISEDGEIDVNNNETMHQAKITKDEAIKLVENFALLT